MTENQNYKSSRYPKYDSMDTQQLQALLQADSESVDPNSMDTEELLYIMEVLAQKNKENIAENEALEAWESFQKDYLDVIEEAPEETGVIPIPTKPRPWLRRWLAAAAVFVLLVGLPITVSAVNWKEAWSGVVEWAGESFHFVRDSHSKEAKPTSQDVHRDDPLARALADHGEDPTILPTWLPEGFMLEKVTVTQTPQMSRYNATYQCGDKNMRIFVTTYDGPDVQNIEADRDTLEVYSHDGQDYYIARNYHHLVAAWVTGPYECVISGEVTKEELKAMIDSIGKE